MEKIFGKLIDSYEIDFSDNPDFKNIQQQIDLGFTHGSESSTQPFFKDDVTFEWKIESSQEQSLYFSDGSSIFDDPLR